MFSFPSNKINIKLEIKRKGYLLTLIKLFCGGGAVPCNVSEFGSLRWPVGRCSIPKMMSKA